MPASTEKPRLLILGGTRFLGPHMIEEAKRRGWRVTLFNRGKTQQDTTGLELLDDVEQLRGDRDTTDLSALEGREFDAVIDTSAYYPRAVREVLEVLDAHVGHYLLISTISVYADFSELHNDEDSELARLDDPTTEEVTPETYGGLKVLCEEAASEHTSGPLTIIRPGIVAGPLDHTDRFTYWPVRTARGGKMAVPAPPENPVQYIDVRDLARWTLDTLDDEITGIFNAVVPQATVTMADFIAACQQAVDSPAEAVWVPEQTIFDQEDPPRFPMWAPTAGDHRGIFTIDADRAVEAGMKVRPIDDTVAATLAWFESLPQERQAHLEAGPTSEQEQALVDSRLHDDR